MSVSPSGGGIVKINGAPLPKYPHTTTLPGGESVRLEASAAPGYEFTGWSGAITDTTNPITIIMDCNRQVAATFNRIDFYRFPFSITVICIGIGVAVIAALVIWYIIKRRHKQIG